MANFAILDTNKNKIIHQLGLIDENIYKTLAYRIIKYRLNEFEKTEYNSENRFAFISEFVDTLNENKDSYDLTEYTIFNSTCFIADNIIYSGCYHIFDMDLKIEIDFRDKVYLALVELLDNNVIKNTKNETIKNNS